MHPDPAPRARRPASDGTAAQERAASVSDCYCSLWSTDPQFLEERGVPRGYCGHCETCGAPGHTRHFPGVSPSTGTWCDRHYRRTMWLHPLGHHGRWVWGAIAAAMAVGVAALAR